MGVGYTREGEEMYFRRERLGGETHEERLRNKWSIETTGPQGTFFRCVLDTASPGALAMEGETFYIHTSPKNCYFSGKEDIFEYVRVKQQSKHF